MQGIPSIDYGNGRDFISSIPLTWRLPRVLSRIIIKILLIFDLFHLNNAAQYILHATEEELKLTNCVLDSSLLHFLSSLIHLFD